MDYTDFYGQVAALRADLELWASVLVASAGAHELKQGRSEQFVARLRALRATGPLSSDEYIELAILQLEGTQASGSMHLFLSAVREAIRSLLVVEERRENRSLLDQLRARVGSSGFASWDPERPIVSYGGRTAYAKSTAHEFSSDEAREAGRKNARRSQRRKESQDAESVKSEANEAAEPAQREAGRTLLDIWFATNRQCSKSTTPDERFENSRCKATDPLSYGRATVSVPHIHLEGRIERPRWWKLEFVEDRRRHMLVQSVDVLDNDAFSAGLHSNAQSSLLFVHGYNVSFGEAILRTAQLAYDLKYPGNPFCFSWASQAERLAYLADEATAEWSVQHLHKVLESLLTSTAQYKGHLDVIAHSMGNRVLLAALDRCRPALLRHVRHVVLAAADIDVDTFKQMKACFNTREQVTAYASRSDRALRVSRVFHRWPRLGDASPPLIIEGIHTIDATSAGRSMLGLGHSYVAEGGGVFADLYYLLRGIGPDSRRSLRRRPGGYYELV